MVGKPELGQKRGCGKRLVCTPNTISKQGLTASGMPRAENLSFGLPNEIYRTADGTIFDLVGIPPDIEVPVFADADVSAGKDPAMGRALEILSQQITSR
jgi:C-terminal processing protease CtpA/Prc